MQLEQAFRRTMPLQTHSFPIQSGLHSQESLYAITGMMPSQQYPGWPWGGSTHFTVAAAGAMKQKNADTRTSIFTGIPSGIK